MNLPDMKNRRKGLVCLVEETHAAMVAEEDLAEKFVLSEALAKYQLKLKAISDEISEVNALEHQWGKKAYDKPVTILLKEI